MNRQAEYAAASRGAHAEVLADLAAIKAAEARGELRGLRHVQVIRNPDGTRRVVESVDPQRRPAASVSSPPAPRVAPPRPSAPIDRPRPAAAYPFPVFTAPASDVRRRRLHEVELDVECDRLRSVRDGARRLRRAESAVYADTVARLGGAILRPGRGATR